MHLPYLRPHPHTHTLNRRQQLIKAVSKPTFLLALFALCLYLLTTGAYIDNPDGRSMYSMTRGLALRGSITIPESERLDSLFEKVGRDDAVYSKYGLIQPLIQLPLFLAGRWISPANERRATETAVSLLQAIVTSATLILLWSIARIIFESERVALALALIYGTATMAWLYATLTYTEPLLTLIILGVCWLLLRLDRGITRSLTITFGVAGVLTGVAILTKYPAVIYTPALIWYAWYLSRSNRGAWFIFVAPLFVGVLGLAYYDFWRYGDILNTGYDIRELIRLPRSPWYGLYTLFFSLGKSVFIYAPPLLIALLALPQFIRQAGAFGRCVLMLLCSSVAFYVVVSPWSGAWSPGPRYQLPILPLALLPLGYLLSEWRKLGLWKQIAICNSVIAGIIVQVIAVCISYSDTLVLLQTITNGQYAWGFWFFDPDYTPLIWQGRLLVAAVAGYLRGHTLVPEFNAISSVSHPGMPIDQINCWFARLPPYDMIGRFISGLLLCVLISVSYRVIVWFRQSNVHTPGPIAQHMRG